MTFSTDPTPRTTARPRRRRRVLLLAACAMALGVSAPTAGAALAPQPGQRLDLKVLLLAASGTEPTFGAWKAQLAREGVPFDAKVADAEAPFTDATFADYGAGHARYQAVILATGDLVHQVTNPDGSVSFPSALADSEWTALAKFEQTFGIRRISDATFPSLLHGLNPPTNTGEQGGNTGTLTAAGRAVFPYLQGPVPIDNGSPTGVDAFGHQATPVTQVAPAAFDVLLSGPGGSSYLGIYTHPDGREEMVMTIDGNENQIHEQLLRHGMLSWATRGVYLGHQRNYFEMQVDDVFLPDDRWDMTLDRTLVDAPTAGPDEITCTPPPAPAGAVACRPIRMIATDVTRLLAWQTASGVKLDMVYNGSGSDEFRAENGGADPFGDAMLANKAAFRWINHTFTHPNLDTVALDVLNAEIAQNTAWGLARGLPMNPQELVTGEHSGLHNGSMPSALTAQGIRWIAADNSREPTPYTIGSATTVPRYPSNIYYNVETQAEQLDEYNHIYLAPPAGRCVASATNTCRTAPATWAEYVASEATIMFRHLMGNDPRPHYAHQSNITGDGILYSVLDEVLRQYKAAFNVPLVQLTHSEIGETMRRQATWAQDVAAGRVTGFLRDGQVTVTSTVATEVPITGTPAGNLYGGERSGWFAVAPGQPLTMAAPGAAAVARSGAAATLGASSARLRTGARASRRLALRLTRLRMSPRRFAVSHDRRTVRRKRGRRPDGTAITFVLTRPATVRLSVQRVRGRRAVRVATLVRRGIAGENVVRFSGRIGRRVLTPGRYRMVVSAQLPTQRTRARAISFTVVRG